MRAQYDNMSYLQYIFEAIDNLTKWINKLIHKIIQDKNKNKI